jgi:glycosyltransferase involved in cell wall biosynthesis
VKILMLTTDAYGGHGGIALYNRDLAEALALMPGVEEVVVLVRTMPLPMGEIPPRIRFVPESAGSKLRYVRAAMAASREHFDLVVCGHINLLPLATALNLRRRAPLVLMGYGIDVWNPPSRWAREFPGRVDAVWCISEITRARMQLWARLPESKYALLPNAIHPERYGMAPRRADLVERFGTAGRKVIMTLARLPSFERYKGIDEVLEVMPGLLRSEPGLLYLIAGRGDDRNRLEAKAEALGLAGHVVFAGFVEEAEKADYFRLADAFVMPGRGEGFGFVFLEALACGVPAVGSRLDGSREALLGGELGVLVDPGDLESVEFGILEALSRPRQIPPGLEHFGWPRFRERVAAAVNSVVSAGSLVA